MTFFSYAVFLSTHLLLVSSLKIPFTRRDATSLVGTLPAHSFKSFLSSSDNNNATALGNVGNIRYTTNVTINGVEVYVALDTGSTDLWVIPPGGIGEFNDTGIPLTLAYGDGTYGVYGTIGVSPFQFGPYSIERQAFLNAQESTIGSITDIGIYGLFGLGFDQAEVSPINKAIQAAYGASAMWGASVLKNIFAQNPSQPDFIAVELSRTDDLEDTAGGSFNIGEYDPTYAAVAATPQLPQYPPGSGRWTTLLDGITVNGVALNLQSTEQGVPSGKVVALFDTGNPQGTFSTDIVRGIYSSFDGAVFDESQNLWIVPCTGTVDVEVIIGGQNIPIHPLDLSEFQWATVGDTNYSVCTSSFDGIDNYSPDFDVAFGDSFLRNVYSVYNFGDPSNSSSVPFMQFLSQVDPTTAAAQTVSNRQAAIATNGPELPPSEILSLINGGSDSSSTSAITSDVNNKTSLDLVSTNSDSNTDKISFWGPIIVGLLAANLVVGLVLIVLGILNRVRRSGRPGKPTVYVPVKSGDDYL